jgi:hypothetical protein
MLGWGSNYGDPVTYPILFAGAVATALAQDMIQERARFRTLNVVNQSGQVIDQVDVLEEDYGAVAAWMGGRGPAAGLGMAPQLGGRFAHGLTEQQIRGLGFTFENPLAYGSTYGKGRIRKLIRRITGRGRVSSPSSKSVGTAPKKGSKSVGTAPKKGVSSSYMQSSPGAIPSNPSAPGSLSTRPQRSRQPRRDVIMGLRGDLEAAKSRGDWAKVAQINQELERIAGPRPS